MGKHLLKYDLVNVCWKKIRKMNELERGNWWNAQMSGEMQYGGIKQVDM